MSCSSIRPAKLSCCRIESILSIVLLCLPALPGFGRNEPPPPPTPVPPVHPAPLAPGLLAPPPLREEGSKTISVDREGRVQRLLKEKKGTLKKEGADSLTPAEREKRRRELKDRLQRRLEVLKKKQKESSLSAEEQQQLTRLEEVSKRFQNPKKETVQTPQETK